MRITNRLNLPAAFVEACSVERHNKPGRYSATTLNKGAKEVILTERHWEELEADAADSVWAVFGTAVHSVLERSASGGVREEQFIAGVSESVVTGIVDCYEAEGGIITDWKTASVWKVLAGGFSDWRNQGMTYAWLLSKNGLAVRKCRFIALLKDHSKSKARTSADYPQSPVHVYEFDVSEDDLAEAEARIFSKVRELEAARHLADDEIPACAAEERWADSEKYAVMRNGRKSAVRVFESRLEADQFAGALGNSCYVEVRPAASRKCAGYCPCHDFCDFYRSGGAGGAE